MKCVPENSRIERDQLAAIFEHVTDGVAVASADGTIEYVNPAYTAMTGYASAEVVGQDVRFLRSESWVRDHLDAARSAVRSGGTWCGEMIGRRKEGVLYREDVKIVPVRDAAGEFSGFITIKRYLNGRPQVQAQGRADDTSQKARAEQMLRESEELFRGGFEHAPIGICVLSMDGFFIRVNESVCRMFGYSREQLLNAPWSLVMYPEELDASKQNMERLISGQIRLVEAVRRYLRHDGNIVLGRVRASLVRDRLDRPQYIVAHIEDLTERTRAEEVLRESEERFLAMADSFPVMMWMTDTHGHGRFINRAYREFCGLTVGQIAGGDWKRLIHPDDAPQYIDGLERAVLERKPFKSEARVRRADGEWRWLASYAQPWFTSAGEYLGHVGVRPDITERKLAENAMQQSERSYRRQFAENSAVMLLTDPVDGRIVDANHAAAGFYGYSREQLQAMRVIDFSIMPACDVRNALASVADKGQRFEFQHRLADGALRDVEISASRLQFGERTVLHLIVFDVTPRKRAEEAVRLSEARLRGITDSAQDAIVMMDPQGAITYWNPAAAAILGHSKEEAIGKDFHDLVAPERCRAAFPDFLHSGGENAIGRTLEAPARRKDGQEIAVDLSLSAIRLEGQWHSIGIIRDITERNRVAARLGETAKRLTLAVRAGGVGIWDYDVVNNRLVWDEQMFRLYGIKREQFLGAYEAWTEGVHPEDRQRADEELQCAIRGEREFDTEFRVVWPDGSVHSIRALALVQRDPSTGAVNVIGTNWDITAQKQAASELEESNRQLREATLRANESAVQASRANAAKSQFLANMSHEIRTPMNGVIGMTDLILDTDLTDDQRSNLTIVKSSAESLLLIVNDILDFSKIEAHKLNLENISFALRSTIDLTMKAMAPRAAEKNLELTYHIAPGVPDLVLGDPGRLRQVLVNLVGNALKFTERGEVVLRVENVSESDEQVGLRFSVRDTGVGISPDKQKSIFDAFVQADTSTSRHFGGAGLGLTISSQLVAMMGGTLAVDSNTGRGSTFHFTVYLTPVRESRETPEPAPLTALQGMNVLAVDDNATNLEILSQILSRNGFHPRLADSGLNALEALKEAARVGNPYPLAIVDVHMPQMDGFELVERIRQEPQLSNLNVILLTSDGRRGDGARCRELGISAYLSKPASETELLETIMSVLGAHPATGRKPELITRHVLRETRESLRTLVVDDSPVNRLLATRLLERHGHVPVCAVSGRTAVEELEKQSFDVVLMDVQMPEMDGFEATRMIRSKERQTGDHIPIVAVTAHAMEGDRERCLSAGMDAYVSKPVSSQSLFAAMNDALSRANEMVLRSAPPFADP